MGFFSDFKEQLATGGNIVTKTVEGTVANVGRLKIQTIDEMTAQGYNLVNEVSEEGYAQKFFGPTTMIRYTLTFKKDPAVLAREEQEKRDRQEKQKQEEEQLKNEIETLGNAADKFCKDLGSGYCVIIEDANGTGKDAITRFCTESCRMKIYKKQIKMTFKILKKYGKVSVLSDCGEKACNNLSKILNDYGATTKVIPYEKKLYINQQDMYNKINCFSDLFQRFVWSGACDMAEDKGYIDPFYKALTE